MAPTTRQYPAILARGILAGIVGAILIDGFLYVTQVRPQGGTMLQLWSFVAMAAMGKGVLANPLAPLYGAIVHLLVSLAWGVAFAWIAASQPYIAKRWLPSGLAYGIVVYLAMDVVMLAAGVLQNPKTPNDLIFQLLAHMVFFGLPIAWIVAAMTPASADAQA
uniref:Uncharacterized protein n=1 Tax=mine drainage metagenome TaxID=410659 RepID=E6Q842_9ZZZZ